jgi:glycosyltransferase involved in cell wall biosynthesis
MLERAVRSALGECREDDEVIVVDDGSKDNTAEIVADFGSRVRYLPIEHAGAGAARNAGIAAASGDLIAFLDSDDEWVPGKLSWQRAIMESRPEILFVFSDFGGITPFGTHVHHQARAWHGDGPFWDHILERGVSSAEIPGLESLASPFSIYEGSIYETLIRHWGISTWTMLVRRKEAGDALRFAEDVGTYEDLECCARLAQRGVAGYMDCETAFQHAHEGPRLTDADLVMRGDAALRITSRVWGTDGSYLRAHREEYETVMDGHRATKIRGLLAQGRSAEARRETALLVRPQASLYLRSLLPGSVLLFAPAVRREVRSHLQAASVAEQLLVGWEVVEHRGGKGLAELEEDWHRLSTATPEPAARHSFEEYVAYLECLAARPDDVRFLALRSAGLTQAIVPLERARANLHCASLQTWTSPVLPQWPADAAIVADSMACRAVVPLVVNYLRHSRTSESLLEIGPLSASSAIWEGLRLMNHADYFVRNAQPGLVIDAAGSVEENRLASVALSKEADAARKRLESLIAIELTTVAEDAEFAAELRTFVDLAIASRTGARAPASVPLGTAPLSVARLLAYCHSISSATAGGVRFEVDCAYLDGRCIAAHLCRHSSAGYAVVQAAYDDAYLSWRPGAVLFLCGVERSFADAGAVRACCAPDIAAQCGALKEVDDMLWAQVSVGRWPGRGAVFVKRLDARARRAVANRQRGIATS